MAKFKAKDFLNQEQHTYEMQNFNRIQIIYLVGLLLLTGIIYVCIEEPIYTYFTLLMAFYLIVTLIDANRTGSIKKCALFISVISNFIYLPLCFYGFGKLICCVPLYYILGILYTVLLIHGTLGVILSVLETVYLCIITIHIGRILPGFYSSELTYVDFIAIGVALTVVSVFAVLAIRTIINQYNSEYDNMKQAHLNVIDAFNSKDIFFANTSHEIRTPLNAIVGTVNLLLDEDLDSKVRENVYNILNSCNALLSITNELMELSNTENNDVSIQKEKYDLAEMLTDIVNMMSVRLIDSEVSLFVDIDNTLPKYLTGDGVKVRQLFINILNNAVKYTKEGRITLKVSGEIINADNINLCVEVNDTGIGIKPENLTKLFSDYSRDDEDEEKRNIEGTGLGLSFCKELVEKMGGSIWAESEYHVGSSFYFKIPQQVYSQEPITRVPSLSREPAIIFDNSIELSEDLGKVLEKLNIPSVAVSDRMAFEDKVMSGKYKYLFISSEKYVENKRFIERKIANHRVVVISDISKSVQIDTNAYLISRPVFLINAAMAYNNVVSTFSREIIQKGGFTCPDTTVLVVDDNLTNLDVASSLLKKYDTNIITAISGQDCLNILEKNEVDLIFMDYMMPEMNGIDTLYALRSLNIDYAKTVPVIALTANVVSGAKEMFLDAGFCEYISKPIDPNKLEKALMNHISRDKIKLKV